MVMVILRRSLLRSLRRDAGLTRRQRGYVLGLRANLPRASVVTAHKTRCRVSGRTHQAFRDVQLARLQLRQQFGEGRLLA